MKNFIKNSVLSVLMMTVLFLTGCQGDQGDPGPQGTAGSNGTNGKDGANGANGKDGANGSNGTNGTNGANGSNGSNGSNGVGFDDAVKYGTITVSMNGKRPDGVAFNKTVKFAYASTNLDYSSISIDENSVYSSVARFELFNNISELNDSYAAASFYQETEDYEYFSFEQNIYISGDDRKYFNLQANFDSDELDNQITDYSYNATTGALKYKFSFTSLADYNSSGNDLVITGEVNAIVFERLNTTLRKKSRAKATPIAKAEMKSF